MGEFTIQISNELVDRLVDDAVSKKKTRRTRRKVAKEPKNPQSDLSQKQILDGSGKPEFAAAPGWPLQPSLFLPATLPVQPAHSEIENIQSVLRESEKVVKRLKAQEENMLQEVTQKAKDLRNKEYKLPNPKPEPCMDEKVASLTCYKEHIKDPLKCASFVTNFADCLRRFCVVADK
ncbi:putative cysteine alpha-hairpin motif superfamily [Lupinus albus]|uniref:Putative cysteine alpha-hairpin motif superfamily n=1 Tax=Lupinus albus TaxID=3870 RepID=A0A6A4PAA9_LUPAL|nr:putative cysteine alpha-hairpin motif superfamily [Lupinus albus]